MFWAIDLDTRKAWQGQGDSLKPVPWPEVVLEGASGAYVVALARELAGGGGPADVLVLGHEPFTQPMPVKLRGGLTLQTADAGSGVRVHLLPRLVLEAQGYSLSRALPGIAALLEASPDFDGVLRLGGPMPAWVRISAEEICFGQNTLVGRFATAAAAAGSPDVEAVQEGLSHPERVMSLSAAHSPEYRHGVVLGADLAAHRAYWLGLPVRLGGDPALRAAYESAGVWIDPTLLDDSPEKGILALWRAVTA